MELDNLAQKLSASVRTVLQLVYTQGFLPTLVGGGTRDFLLQGKISQDLDFEVRWNSLLEELIWVKKLKHLAETLEAVGTVEQLPYSIIRLSLEHYELEFSSPRLEEFVGSAPFGHRDFETKLVSQMSYAESFARRDFTLNAIGLEFSPEGTKVCDPLQGQQHLQAKKLVPCGENFYHDPVRMLRALRFEIKLGLAFAGDWQRFNLSKLTPYYLLSEALKSKDAGVFFQRFFSLAQQLKLGESVKNLSFLGEFTCQQVITNKAEFIQGIKVSKLSLNEKQKVSEAFGIRKSSLSL